MVTLQAKYIGRELYLLSKTELIVMGDYYYRPKYKEVFRGSGWLPDDLKVVASTEFLVDVILLPKSLKLKREEL